jgi:ribose transport system ATP-binding protein
VSEQLLRIRSLDKVFPGVRALNCVDFDLEAGEIHCLVGENGAGKSTLVEVLSGSYRPDGGEIAVHGEVHHFLTPSRALALGIDTVHQEDQLVASITAAENIFMGHLPGGPAGFFNSRRCLEEARRLIDSLGLHLDPSRVVEKLSPVERKTVCIAKALSRRVRILILDEPSATLGLKETRLLLEVVRNVRAQGIGIIYISHFISEVFEIADRITVFKDGRRVATHRVAEVTPDEVIHEMVGRRTAAVYARPPHSPGEPILEVRGMTRRGVVEDVSFTVRRGEIFGIGGLVGSGRTELAQLLFGLERRDEGSVLFEGRDVTPASPLQAIRSGLGFLTEDRKASGLVLRRSVQENIGVVDMTVRRPLVLDLKAERGAARRMVDALSIATPTVDQLVMNLSGGNQQKVVLAKWMLGDADVVIFDEPTVGIDVGAKKEIYALMHEMAGRGKVILMISSDLPELIALSDRIGIMRRGRLVSILEGAGTTEETVLKLATGV